MDTILRQINSVEIQGDYKNVQLSDLMVVETVTPLLTRFVVLAR